MISVVNMDSLNIKYISLSTRNGQVFGIMMMIIGNKLIIYHFLKRLLKIRIGLPVISVELDVLIIKMSLNLNMGYILTVYYNKE